MGYEKLTLKERQFYLAKFEGILASKKLFLKKDFSLPELASESDIPLHIISYLINSEIKLHFKDYINLMRIEYFKEKINCTQWNDLTLEKMILASGFKSRTTCYRAFLKHVGITPLKYLESKKIAFNHQKTSEIFFLNVPSTIYYRYLEKLESTITSKKLFLKNDFTLPNLAEETGIQLSTLSYLINSGINSRFNDYINLKRIEYFKEKITEPEWKGFTIDEMSKASGFRSRTTCYRAFLKHIGMTPYEYVKGQKES